MIGTLPVSETRIDKPNSNGEEGVIAPIGVIGDFQSLVENFFADPPDWLPRQLAVYRENPERHLRPLCTAVAAVVLDSSVR